MSSSPSRIAIVGAGIAGLTAALALLQRGYDVDIFEQSVVLNEVGAGLQISPNGVKVLMDLGLEERVARISCAAAGKEVRLWNTGQTWKLFDLGEDSIARFGAPYWTVHRGDLHRVLLEAFRERMPDRLHTGRQCLDFRQTDSWVDLHFADGSTGRYEAVVAADGVHSKARHALVGSDAPYFTGLIAWRSTIPISKLPAELQRPVGVNWVGPGAHVITYPLRRGELLNFVGIVEKNDWSVESWTSRGTRDACAEDFRGWHPLVQTLTTAVEEPLKWALLGRPPLQCYAMGRVCLIGDAAHPTLPFLAQGAVMALEDGLVLARCLERLRAPEAAFRRFDELRLKRTADIVRGSAENAKRFHHAELADPALAVAYVTREWKPDLVRRRYDWLFEYDPRSVAI